MNHTQRNEELRLRLEQAACEGVRYLLGLSKPRTSLRSTCSVWANTKWTAGVFAQAEQTFYIIARSLLNLSKRFTSLQGPCSAWANALHHCRVLAQPEQTHNELQRNLLNPSKDFAFPICLTLLHTKRPTTSGNCFTKWRHLPTCKFIIRSTTHK